MSENYPASELRSPVLGSIPGLAREFDRDFSLEMFSRASFTRQFDYKVKEAYDKKLFEIPIYLSVGQEFISAALSMVLKNFNIFGQHRCHGIYLAFGGVPEKLRDELLGLPSGCAGGMAGDNSLQSPENKMFGHSGLMGEQVPIAVGAALASREPCLTIMGDASVEEDYMYPSFGYAVTKKLPILFVCEDNNLSILTPVKVRRNWNPVDFLPAMGMPAIDLTDDPWLIAHHVRKLVQDLPAFVSVRTVRHLWHAGTGSDGVPEWDRYELVKQEMEKLGLAQEVKQIEEETSLKAAKIWEEPLRKP